MITKIQTKPGDLLVVSVKGPITAAGAAAAVKKVKEKLPSGVDVLLVEDGYDLTLLSPYAAGGE